MGSSETVTGNTPTPLTLGDRTFRSRLFVGTGKYSDAETMNAALEASGCEVVTVAIRRVASTVATISFRNWTVRSTSCSPIPPAVSMQKMRFAFASFPVNSVSETGSNLKYSATAKPCFPIRSAPLRRVASWWMTASRFWSTAATTPCSHCACRMPEPLP